MKGLRKLPADKPELARARKRVAKMGTTELMEWADTVISGMGKGFNDFRREEDEASLLEIRDHALPGLIALVDELLLRHEAANS